MKENKVCTFLELYGSLCLCSFSLMIMWKIGNKLQFLHKTVPLSSCTHCLFFRRTDEIKKN